MPEYARVRPMSPKLKEIMQRAETWPEEVQEEAAETLLSIERGHVGGYILTAEDRAALARSAEDVQKGRFASEEQVANFFDRNRRA
jgi:hypothetical protein